ncbi:hypothetical protein JDV02_007572 [Purpureocillium takamizusanense]|uniref:Uncharacterized protein n=1 Tax=Purpureocillium takamizusanense TaxID=2060973 RepID=A0A9Q8QLV1_9HYPO|nr:uncharacterized protein JDV02_007572 [Purpureocillium takamizusanense]UNI21597.1 hypothetical protein JDV02_007572 [Purpureocillium takamizusanense]
MSLGPRGPRDVVPALQHSKQVGRSGLQVQNKANASQLVGSSPTPKAPTPLEGCMLQGIQYAGLSCRQGLLALHLAWKGVAMELSTWDMQQRTGRSASDAGITGERGWMQEEPKKWCRCRERRAATGHAIDAFCGWLRGHCDVSSSPANTGRQDLSPKAKEVAAQAKLGQSGHRLGHGRCQAQVPG